MNVLIKTDCVYMFILNFKKYHKMLQDEYTFLKTFTGTLHSIFNLLSNPTLVTMQ